jgi:hypothetical protein
MKSALSRRALLPRIAESIFIVCSARENSPKEESN